MVIKGGRRGVVVAHQNWSGKKTVSEAGFDPDKLTSGKVMVYRPE